MVKKIIRKSQVVIVAGYTVPMTRFFASNPGLKSRFNTFIKFEDYTSDELETILALMCKNNDYEISANALVKIKKYLDDKVADKGENFSNGRMVRNIYDDLVMNHAKRVVNIENANRENSSMITAEDFILPT